MRLPSADFESAVSANFHHSAHYLRFVSQYGQYGEGFHRGLRPSEMSKPTRLRFDPFSASGLIKGCRLR